jgi:hypothetical protein
MRGAGLQECSLELRVSKPVSEIKVPKTHRWSSFLTMQPSISQLPRPGRLDAGCDASYREVDIVVVSAWTFRRCPGLISIALAFSISLRNIECSPAVAPSCDGDGRCWHCRNLDEGSRGCSLGFGSMHGVLPRFAAIEAAPIFNAFTGDLGGAVLGAMWAFDALASRSSKWLKGPNAVGLLEPLQATRQFA